MVWKIKPGGDRNCLAVGMGLHYLQLALHVIKVGYFPPETLLIVALCRQNVSGNKRKTQMTFRAQE